MQKQLKVTYHYNSSFSIRIGGGCWCLILGGEGRRLAEVGRRNQQILSATKPPCFRKPRPPDHFAPRIFGGGRTAVFYIVSSDIPWVPGQAHRALETLSCPRT